MLIPIFPPSNSFPRYQLGAISSFVKNWQTANANESCLFDPFMICVRPSFLPAMQTANSSKNRKINIRSPLTLNCPPILTLLFWLKLGLKPLGLLTRVFGLAQSSDKARCFLLTANAILCHAPSAMLSWTPARTGAAPLRLYSNSIGFKLKDKLWSPSLIVNKSAVLSGCTFTVANTTNSSGIPLGNSDPAVVFITSSVEDRSYATSRALWSSEKGSGLLSQSPVVSRFSSSKFHWNSCTRSATSAVSKIDDTVIFTV